MLSTGSNLSFTRKGIKYGVAASLSFIASLIPNLVQGQILPEELEVPLRPEMQLPICGRIESKTTFALPEASVKQSVSSKTTTSAKSTVSPSSGNAATKGNVSTSGNVATSKQVAKATVGNFNQSQHVKEFSWLSDDAVTQEEPEPTKVRSVATTTKNQRIDPAKVKVGKTPHCSGVADYYADQFHGRKTASGQLHDREKFTAAHRTLPFGTKLKVVNRNTGKACIVTVNDRGPFTKSRIIDLSCAAAKELGLMTAKSRLVDCYIVENE
jgi:rare lipoprotein A